MSNKAKYNWLKESFEEGLLAYTDEYEWFEDYIEQHSIAGIMIEEEDDEDNFSKE